MNESRIELKQKWYFGNNRAKNLRLSPPQWYAPFFLTTDYDYAEIYSDYGVYGINLESESNLNILNFSKPAEVKKLNWPKILTQQILSGKSDLNAIAYDMYILAYNKPEKLSYISNTVEWKQAAQRFKLKSKNILQQIPRTSSIWGSDDDHAFVLQMWKDIYDAGFDGFEQLEFNHRILAIFSMTCIDKISIYPVVK